jgi:hypothetical protein
MKHQFELPSAGLGGVFNLSGERADDPFRLEREHWEAQERIRTRLDYAAKMQLQLKDCPGFCSCDAPSSEDEKGRVVVEPGRIVEATQWLKRRFDISENLELSPDNGLAIDFIARKRVPGCKAGGKRVRVRFQKPEQFALALVTESEQTRK